MNLQGRALNVCICQNLDGLQFGAVLDVSNNVESIGNIGWSLDTQVTETSISDCTVDLVDPGWAIWSWVQANLPSSEGNLPAFLVVVLGGVIQFYGIIPFNEIYQDAEECKVKLTSHSWFSMAALEILNSIDQSGNPTAWSRQPVPILLSRTQSVDTGTSLPANVTNTQHGDGGAHG